MKYLNFFYMKVNLTEKNWWIRKLYFSMLYVSKNIVINVLKNSFPLLYFTNYNTHQHLNQGHNSFYAFVRTAVSFKLSKLNSKICQIKKIINLWKLETILFKNYKKINALCRYSYFKIKLYLNFYHFNNYHQIVIFL